MKAIGPAIPHPGAALRRKFEDLGVCHATIAKHLGLSRQTLHKILQGRQSITPRVALRIGKLTGTAAEGWLERQLKYDLALARLSEHEVLLKVPELGERW